MGYKISKTAKLRKRRKRHRKRIQHYLRCGKMDPSSSPSQNHHQHQHKKQRVEKEEEEENVQLELEDANKEEKVVDVVNKGDLEVEENFLDVFNKDDMEVEVVDKDDDVDEEVGKQENNEENEDELDHESDEESDGEEPEPDTVESTRNPSRNSGGENRGRFGRLIPTLSNSTDPMTQLVGLNELCEDLSMCEDELSLRDSRSLSPVLVALVNSEANPEIVLLAVRAITYLCDVSTSASAFLVQDNVVNVLCSKLMVIEYLDVAEQCIQALEKISRNHPVNCLQGGTILAVLSYIDFFSPSVQRVALSTVVNVCMELHSNYSSQYMEAVPVLCNLLNYEDQKIVENVTTCLTRIIKQTYQSSEKLDELCNHGLIHQVTRLIASNGGTTLSPPIYSGLIGILTSLAAGSVRAGKTLLEINIGSALKNILSSYDYSHINPNSLVVGYVNSNQIHGVFKLLLVLLPPLSKNTGDNQVTVEKEKFIRDKPELLQQFGRDLLPVLVQMVNSGANLYVCYASLLVINKILYFSKSDMLPALLSKSNISSFLSAMLTRRDPHLRVLALNIVKTILKELPNAFVESFIKEGVFYAIEAILTPENCSPNPSSSSNREACLCYAFTPSSGSTPCKLKDTSVTILAKQIKTTYFSTEFISGLEVTKTIQKLRCHCAELSEMVDPSTNRHDCAKHEESLSHILGQIMGELSGGECLSSFEIIESGIVKSLINYLSNGQYQDGKMNPHGLLNHSDLILKRFELFVRLSLSSTTQHWKDMPLATLIKFLQSAVSSLENFPVILNHASKIKRTYATIVSKTRTKVPCLNVRFMMGEGERNLQDYNTDVEKVDASTSVGDIESFLWSEVGTNEGKGDSQNLMLYLDGKPLDQKMSLYQVILMLRVKAENDLILRPNFWNEVYEITYRNASNLQESNPQDFFKETPSNVKDYPFLQNVLSPLISEFPHKLSSLIYDSLVLLKILDVINRYAFQLMSHETTKEFSEERSSGINNVTVNVSKVPETEFVNIKLTEKLEQQMQDPLALSDDSMPSWCGQLMAKFPFLFSFEARSKYFRLTSFQVQPNSLSQSASNAQSVSNASNASSLKHTKFTVFRNNVLDSASKMMDGHADSKTILEVEYDNEVGTGQGPTIEFYTLVSREFQKVGLGMWRDDPGLSTTGTGSEVEDSGHVVSQYGLLPRPWSATSSTVNGILFSDVIKKFTLLGQIVARALKDGRVLDLPLSKCFYKLILNQELNIYDIFQSIDPALGKVLVEFQGLINRKKILNSVSGKSTTSISSSYFQNTRIEDLFLDFSLPGYPDYLLTCAHDHKMVNINNVDEYVSLTVDATVKTGISRQVEAFKSGFSQVFPIQNLQIFTEEELECLLCGERDAWDTNDLLHHIKFDHGYIAQCPPITNLIEIMQEFECKHQRAFLQFVTGAPRLPIGGLAALKPKLTVVCKHSSEADAELPSVMTCVNYLKLPPYSSKEVMREKLLYAMIEGQGSFHLS